MSILLINLSLILLGILAGLIVSFAGASGVMLVVPALMLIFSTDIYTAIGTSLFVDFTASIIVAYGYWKAGNVNLKGGMLLTITAIIGTQLGIFIGQIIGDTILGHSFASFLLIFGASMILRSFKDKNSITEEEKSNDRGPITKGREVVVILLGLSIGIISGLFGAGGGLMILFALTVLLKYPIHEAIGTSTLIMAVIAFSGSMGYYNHGNVNIVLGLFISIGTIAGGYFGSKVANKLNENTTKFIMGIIFILLGLLTLLIE